MLFGAEYCAIQHPGAKRQFCFLCVCNILRKLPEWSRICYWSHRHPKLENEKLISRYELKNNHVFLYLSSVSSKTVELPLKMEMGNRVLNVAPSSVYAYDYYDTDQNGYAAYSHPCSGGQ
ncbi:murinoglobulin-2-like isoform X1 [Xenopus tropicalis]|uniref:Murinoglobulin-2-like isoform X1 n=1 Tax=Xenopus tropicalis TaxID=8364 RepID=A0A8J1JTR7_XENTR|nr:murinoglobulin-2-like isoform X1 [Xenopus tropicalis]XP_031761283.1 murinoglobulin-2-like isoform X1 [Xenopus tropicalis]